MGPGITANRPGADDRYLFLRHYVFSHIKSMARRSARSMAILVRRTYLRHAVDGGLSVMICSAAAATTNN
jgi:hypothetical protein